MAQSVMVPMAEQPVRPVPPGGYAVAFGDPGAKNATEITLTSLDEPGYEVTFNAFGISSQNRVRSLLEESIAHLATEDGARGFIHPVILITPGHYLHREQNRQIFLFDYKVIDWMRDSGELLSRNPAAPQIDGPEESPDSAEPDAPPWA